MSTADDILDLLKPDYSTPVASEKPVTRNGEFYHGTSRDLVPGDHVLPWQRLRDMGLTEAGQEAPHGGTHSAWAHVNPEGAATYGPNVYRVKGTGRVLEDGRVLSSEGFEVLERHKR